MLGLSPRIERDKDLYLSSYGLSRRCCAGTSNAIILKCRRLKKKKKEEGRKERGEQENRGGNRYRNNCQFEDS